MTLRRKLVRSIVHQEGGQPADAVGAEVTADVGTNVTRQGQLGVQVERANWTLDPEESDLKVTKL